MVAKGENVHVGFKKLLSQGRLKLGLCGKELTHSQIHCHCRRQFKHGSVFEVCQ